MCGGVWWWDGCGGVDNLVSRHVAVVRCTEVGQLLVGEHGCGKVERLGVDGVG